MKTDTHETGEATAQTFFPFQSSILCSDRHLLNGHRSALIWFTGLSGSGKSTLAHAVEERLYQLGVRSYVLDGDNIRTGLNKDLGLSPEDRKENIRRIAEVAKLMVDAGILVFAAFIAPYRESRAFVRGLMNEIPYFECYVKCALEVCEERDPKGLYKRSRAGEITNMTGLSAPYEAPENPDILVETDRHSLDACVDRLLNFLIEKRIVIRRRNF
ncbi:adenylyl-sulfate kinase [Desulfoferrobacter suflitae]|uniref:adenylyl-sulfate kinase n=1 Tax=Desulfoferrobacter suflitae TaxID=2865782 RepID=UPI0021649E81|nr:adenylyl-sulfate kinase [Desulfoferrobacter suflitae]MCK8602280.1 adenylyl-sulfate kinase [Desulfoferrobacter suflitae]